MQNNSGRYQLTMDGIGIVVNKTERVKLLWM